MAKGKPLDTEDFLSEQLGEGNRSWMNRSIDLLSYGEPLVGFYPIEAVHQLGNRARKKNPRSFTNNRTGKVDTNAEPDHLSAKANEMVPLKTPWMATWGGDTSNVVLAASKLGLSCAYLSRVGEDPFGEGFFSLWESSGIQTRLVQKDPHHPTGLYFVSFREGKHILTYYRKDSAATHIDPNQFDPAVLNSVRVLHLSGISLAISPRAREFGVFLMQEARKRGTLVSFDTNFRPALWGKEEARQVLEQIIPAYVHVLATTDEEMELLGWGQRPEAMAQLLRGPAYYLVKQGSKGAYVRSSQEELFFPSFQVPVVDTVGAGDAFDAGFLRALLHSDPLRDAARYASAVAALVCTGQGPLEKQPTHREVEAFLRKQSQSSFIRRAK